MSIPLFFAERSASPGSTIELDEENSKHIAQVLRMKEGGQIRLTDGRGNIMLAEITSAHKKHCRVVIRNSDHVPAAASQLTIAISPVKNMSRFEWFVEKAAELGTAGIIPLICERTEKFKVRHDRLVSIARSAMLQSDQAWLANVHEQAKFADVVNSASQSQKIIAHCTADEGQPLGNVFDKSLASHLVLIGPEGDFSPAELELAKAKGFVGVSLGRTILRTETAGLFAAVVCRS